MMTKLKPSDSLDNWREYFRRGDSDIFDIIDHAIMVAATDCPKEFKSKRDRIAQLLFSSKVSRCIGCDYLELPIAEDEEKLGVATDGGEAEALSDELGEEASVTVDEVMRIKHILLNKDDEPKSLLLESMRKLESMSMTVDILKATEIGKAVTSMRKHSSEKINKLAKTLFTEWKGLVDQWLNAPKERAGDERTPESANLSVVNQTETFPSPPRDFDIFAPEANGFELSKILDCLDSDGNPRCSVESKHERKSQSSMRKRPMKHSATDCDEPRRQPKQSREQMVDTTQRKPLVAAEQKRKLAGTQQYKLKAMDDPDAKFEFAKRKLQESYKQHENAKRQRTIQVLETIPEQSKTEKPQLKRSVRR